MPKTDIKYDARVELTLESELKQAVSQFAQHEGISRNEAIRRAISLMLYDPACKQLESENAEQP